MIIKMKAVPKGLLEEFSNLPVDNTKPANDFFEKFGAGNSLDSRDIYAFDRLAIYESLLNSLIEHDFEKYQIIHKGTPFYMMAWLAFDLKNYEKALYYIDAAISEDVRASISDWSKLPASKFLTLEDTDVQVARRTIEIIRSTLTEELARFISFSGLPPIDLNSFISRFVKPLLTDPSKRTIISAFYVFLLEHSERQKELKLRSLGGGSIAPFILHLFSGGLIFESILKSLFLTKDDGSPIKTIGDIFHTSTFQGIYPSNIPTSATSIADIVTGVTNNSVFTAFSTAAKIRNTTGHNLVWDDIFASPANYQRLFEQEVNAIFYIVNYSY